MRAEERSKTHTSVSGELTRIYEEVQDSSMILTNLIMGVSASAVSA